MMTDKWTDGTLDCPGTGQCINSVSITVPWKSTGNVESFQHGARMAVYTRQ